MSIIQRYNPVSGHFDLVNTSSGGTNPIWGYVANYSALPLGVTPSDPAIGDLVGANASQGIYWINYRANGFYKRIALTGVAATDYGTTPFASFSNAADQATVDAAAVGDQYVSPITMAGASQFQYLDATSSIQTQLDNKLATFDYFNTTSYATVDGATVYFGKTTAVNTSGSAGFTSPVPLPSGKIVKVIVGVYSSASLASTELSTLSLLTTTTTRYDTTNLISASFSLYTGAIRQNFQSFNVNIDVVAGVSCMQLDLATFATNPSVQIFVSVLMRL